MEHSKQDREILLAALEAGKLLLENGAEIFRVEETIYRICKHFGLTSASAFVLSNGIFLTSGDENESETQFAKVLLIPVNRANLGRVAEVNQLSRQIENGDFTAEQVRQELKRIQQMPEYPERLQIISAGISGACFSYLFGGGWLDGLCTVGIGMVLYWYLLKIGKPHFSKIVCNILGSALVALLSIICHRLFAGTRLESMLVGGIIIMVPGVPFTNAIRDMADGDYISGSVRMLDAILVFFCIAMGAGFMMAIYNGITGVIL
ncbi:MAG: threonine/serine exporter family protein [Lachnospiraceae bacterium]|jgi:uncharacterized membrane protein YjjP (DUF1212 family)|nr:threonine/serine exporter family protein [Lachnospiraceae bacterium]